MSKPSDRELAAHGRPFRFQPPEWQERLPSTNTCLLDRLRSGERLPPGYVLAVREQTAGRGRFDRLWVSQPGRDIAFSFVADIGEAVNPASLAMAVALGVVDALSGLDVAAGVKWPNDVVARRGKIAGILAEQAPAGGGPATLVVGVGLNLNMTGAEAGRIDQRASSVLIETGSRREPEDVLPCLLGPIEAWINRWRERGFAALRAAWEKRCLHVHERIELSDGGVKRNGILAGFGDEGELLLDEGGAVRRIWSGDVRAVRRARGTPANRTDA